MFGCSSPRAYSTPSSLCMCRVCKRRQFSATVLPTPRELLRHRLSSSSPVLECGQTFSSAISSLTFSPLQSNIFCSGSSSGELCFWKYGPIKLLKQVQAHSSEVRTVHSFSTDPVFVTASDDATLKVWSLREADVTQLREYPGHTSFVVDCSLSDAQYFVASVSVDCMIKIWHLSSRDCVFTIPTKAACSTIQFLPNEIHMFVTSDRDGIHVWDIRQLSSYIQQMEVFSGMQRAKSNDCISQSDESLPQTHLIWDDIGRVVQRSQPYNLNRGPRVCVPGSWASSSNIWSVMSEDNPENVGSSSECYDGRAFLNTCDYQPIAKFSREFLPSSTEEFCKFTKTYYRPFSGHDPRYPVFSAIISHDGRSVISSSRDNCHKLWDLATQSGMHTFAGANLAFSPKPCLSCGDSMLLSVSGQSDLYIWDTFRGCTAFMIAHAHAYPITAACFSPSGDMIVSGDASGEITLRTAIPAEQTNSSG